MGRSLADRFPVCRDAFAEADAALGEPLSALCFEGPAERLQLTEYTQPAILTVSVAASRLLASRGIAPAFAAGHSLGEYAAHVAAGTLSFADAVRIVRRRGRYMQEAVPVGTGAMAAIIGLDAAAVQAACDGAAAALPGRVVSPANFNAPGQIVIAGHADAVERAGELASAAGARRVLPLAVSAPFHCALMAPAEARLEPDLRALAAHDPACPVVANVDAEPRRDAAGAIDALVRQVSRPVQWEAVVARLEQEGVTTCDELGPGLVLAGLICKIYRRLGVVNVDAAAGAEAPLACLGAEPS
jgi:[acyl-carrier-protein] S-malonyltransferase